MTGTPLLAVEGLVTEFRSEHGLVRANAGVSYRIEPGEVVGLVGESGSGKSVSARALMGLVEPASAVREGRVVFKGRDLRRLGEAEMRRLRGAEIGMIFQDPMSALNPVLKVGDQLARVYAEHMGGLEENRRLDYKGLMRRGRERALELLETVRIPDPLTRIDQYPHQFSGGMRQRVMIAMALMCRPSLLIADEPTTALDATVELQVVELLKALQREFGMSILFISHNLGVVAKLCDRVIVMYAGRVVEDAPTLDLFRKPLHPYARSLLASIPRGSKHDGLLPAIQGEPPNLARLPAGCPFAPRCPLAVADCALEQRLQEVSSDRRVACHRALDTMPASPVPARQPEGALR